jgi:CSLREA domain-containing protein
MMVTVVLTFLYCGSGITAKTTYNNSDSPLLTGASRDLPSFWSGPSASEDEQSVKTAAEQVTVVVRTNPAGLAYTVDSALYTTTVPFVWEVGSMHTVSTASPQGSGDTSFAWISWSDGGEQMHTFTVAGDGTLTANFQTRYYLLMGTGGTFNTTPPSGFFDAGQQVQIHASASMSYCYFWHWVGTGNGSYSGSSSTATVMMNGPIREYPVGECQIPTSTPTATPTVTPSPVTTPVYNVNSTEDNPDAVPGDRICADANGMCTLRAAITESNAVASTINIINLPAGAYTQTLAGPPENANASGDLDITAHSITIHGTGPDVTFIQASDMPDIATERVMHVLNGANLSMDGLTIRNGKHLFVSSADPGGGGILFEGPMTKLALDNVVISNNVSQGSGGGIRIGSVGQSVVINNSSILNNRAGSDVPGAPALGGGLEIKGEGSNYYTGLTISNSVISGNRVETSSGNSYGGGMSVKGNDWLLNVSDSTLSNNQANSNGRGFRAYGGSFYNEDGVGDIYRSNIEGNSSSGFAGGVATKSSTDESSLTFFYSTIKNNLAPNGGGIMNFGDNTGGAGGHTAYLYFDRSTISGNMASEPHTGVGGGIYSSNAINASTYLTLALSTVSGNHAAIGGGVYNEGSASLFEVMFSTIAANSAEVRGGGIWQGQTVGGRTRLLQSLIADNTSPDGPDIYGTAISSDYNHIDDISGTTFTAMPHDLTGVDAQLGPLADNGGLTFTHLPGPNSPVRNTIPQDHYSCGTYIPDQTSRQRLVGAGCEKGSVEIQGETPTPTNTPTNTPTFTPTGTPTNTPTATPTGTPTATPIPGCSPSVDIINDGGFEIGGVSNAIWNYPNTGQVLCRYICANAVSVPPRTGDVAASFRQSFDPVDVSLGQNVFIPAGRAQLLFWMRIGEVSAPFEESLVLRVDGSVIRTFNQPFSPEQVYTQRTVDLDRWADGMLHNIAFEFRSDATGTHRVAFVIDDVSLLSTANCPGPPPGSHHISDFDGDGKTDVSVFRPSDGNWYYEGSVTGYHSFHFGISTDIPAPADLDGDHKTDISVYRPSMGVWYWIDSSDNTFKYAYFGVDGDIPQPRDIDGDGSDDIAVFRPTEGNWYWRRSSDGGFAGSHWGQNGDIAVSDDYNGDGYADLAVYRQGDWYGTGSGPGGGFSFQVSLGGVSDTPVPSDYDGDGLTDVAVFSIETGDWRWINSDDHHLQTIHWGQSGDIPVPGDYDGDGRDDIAVYRGGTWYINGSTSGPLTYVFGLSGDLPIPKMYIR